jgi:hypothetical protein
MIISGAIIPVGVKNKNGWGILDSEIQNVVKTLKGKAITVCPRGGDAHGCDFDPKSEIGNVTDVWFDPFSKKIRAMAEVTDTIAKGKISDGTWKPNWSVRLAAKENVDGWTKDVEGKNITIVPEGAWPDAKFNVLASNEDGGFEVSLIANFDIAPAPSEPSIQKPMILGTISFVPTENSIMNAVVGSITPTSPASGVSSPSSPEGDGKQDDVLGGKSMSDKKDEKDQTVETLTAALTERDQKIADLEKKFNDFTAGQADTVATKAKEIADMQITAYKASLARDSAVKEYVTAANKRGIKDVDVKMFDGMTAEQITGFTASLAKIEVPEEDATAALRYPVSTPEENGALSVGIPEVQPDGSVKWVDKL